MTTSGGANDETRQMLTDEQLRDLASELVPSRDESWALDIGIVSHPPGAWVQLRHVHGRQYLGVWPLFIDRRDGLVTRLGIHDSSRATKALHQLIADGRVEEAKAILTGADLSSPWFESWVRLWLVGANDRYSNLPVPTVGDTTPQDIQASPQSSGHRCDEGRSR